MVTKKSLLLVASLSIIGFSQQIKAFCWENKSSSYPKITVLGFKSETEYDIWAKINGWSETVINGAKDLIFSAGLVKDEATKKGIEESLPTVNKLTAYFNDVALVKFKADVSKGEACSKNSWNQSQIQWDTLYFAVINPDTNKPLWVGEASKAAALTFTDLGILIFFLLLIFSVVSTYVVTVIVLEYEKMVNKADDALKAVSIENLSQAILIRSVFASSYVIKKMEKRHENLMEAEVVLYANYNFIRFLFFVDRFYH